MEKKQIDDLFEGTRQATKVVMWYRMTKVPCYLTRRETLAGPAQALAIFFLSLFSRFHCLIISFLAQIRLWDLEEGESKNSIKGLRLNTKLSEGVQSFPMIPTTPIGAARRRAMGRDF